MKWERWQAASAPSLDVEEDIVNSTSGLIVVGVDGGPHGDAALRFAVDEAERTGEPLKVLTCWAVSPNTSPYAGGHPTLDELESQARAMQEAALERVLGTGHTVQLSTHLRRGDAGVLLVQVARDARMLVVGSRALGTLRGALLGSVSRYCAQHARCPVVVVPSTSHAPARHTAAAGARTR